MVSARESLSVDVVDVAATEIAREDTEDAMPERARKVHHPESLRLNCESSLSW